MEKEKNELELDIRKYYMSLPFALGCGSVDFRVLADNIENIQNGQVDLYFGCLSDKQQSNQDRDATKINFHITTRIKEFDASRLKEIPSNYKITVDYHDFGDENCLDLFLEYWGARNLTIHRFYFLFNDSYTLEDMIKRFDYIIDYLSYFKIEYLEFRMPSFFRRETSIETIAPLYVKMLELVHSTTITDLNIEISGMYEPNTQLSIFKSNVSKLPKDINMDMRTKLRIHSTSKSASKTN